MTYKSATAKRWRHPFQVVRMFSNGALIVLCSHRWEVTADCCARWRDVPRWLALVGLDPYHDVRATPERAA